MGGNLTKEGKNPFLSCLSLSFFSLCLFVVVLGVREGGGGVFSNIWLVFLFCCDFFFLLLFIFYLIMFSCFLSKRSCYFHLIFVLITIMFNDGTFFFFERKGTRTVEEGFFRRDSVVTPQQRIGMHKC